MVQENLAICEQQLHCSFLTVGDVRLVRKQKVLDNNEQKEIFPRPEEEDLVPDSTKRLQVLSMDNKQTRKYSFSNRYYELS